MKRTLCLITTIILLVTNHKFILAEMYNTDAKNIIKNETLITNIDDKLTRGEATRILIDTNLFGHNNYAVNPFLDLKPNNSCYNSILSLYKYHIYNGIEESGKLYANAEQPLTREQAVILIAKSFSIDFRNSPNLIPEDFDLVSDYAKPSLLTCLENGIVNLNNNHFYPNDTITKTDYLQMIDSALQIKPYDNIRGEYKETTFSNKDVSPAIELKTNKENIKIDESFTFTTANKSSQNYVYGEELQLEVYMNGNWFWIPFNKGGINDDLIILNGNSIREDHLKLSNYIGELESGHYRIIRIVYLQVDIREKQNAAFCSFEFNLTD